MKDKGKKIMVLFLFLVLVCSVYGTKRLRLNDYFLNVTGGIITPNITASDGTIETDNLSTSMIETDHIAEARPGHNVVFDNSIKMGSIGSIDVGADTFALENSINGAGTFPVIRFDLNSNFVEFKKDVDLDTFWFAPQNKGAPGQNVDLGRSGQEWKDLYIDRDANIGNNLIVTGNITANEMCVGSLCVSNLSNVAFNNTDGKYNFSMNSNYDWITTGDTTATKFIFGAEGGSDTYWVGEDNPDTVRLFIDGAEIMSFTQIGGTETANLLTQTYIWDNGGNNKVIELKQNGDINATGDIDIGGDLDVTGNLTLSTQYNVTGSCNTGSIVFNDTTMSYCNSTGGWIRFTKD